MCFGIADAKAGTRAAILLLASSSLAVNVAIFEMFPKKNNSMKKVEVVIVVYT